MKAYDGQAPGKQPNHHTGSPHLLSMARYL